MEGKSKLIIRTVIKTASILGGLTCYLMIIFENIEDIVRFPLLLFGTAAILFGGMFPYRKANK